MSNKRNKGYSGYRQFRKIREMEVSESGKISGKAITFDVVDDIGCGLELIERSSINEADMGYVNLHVEHMTHWEGQLPLATYREGDESSSLKLDIREDGIYFETILDIEGNPKAAEAYSAIKRGDVTGMSFGFNWNDEGGMEEEIIDGELVYVVKKISYIDEISIVSKPAYNDSYVEARSKHDARKDLIKRNNSLVSTKEKNVDNSIIDRKRKRLIDSINLERKSRKRLL